MSTIDDLIAQLHSRAAERLLLTSGKPPVLTVDGELLPAGDDTLERDALDGMILLMGGDDDPGQQQFAYDAPSGAVSVTARRTDRLVQLIIVPAVLGVAEAGRSPQDGPDPAPSEGAGEQGPPAAAGESVDDFDDAVAFDGSDREDPATHERPGDELEPADSPLGPVEPDPAAGEVLEATSAEAEGEDDEFARSYLFGAEVQRFGPSDDAAAETEWFDPARVPPGWDGGEPPASAPAQRPDLEPANEHGGATPPGLEPDGHPGAAAPASPSLEPSARHAGGAPALDPTGHAAAASAGALPGLETAVGPAPVENGPRPAATVEVKRPALEARPDAPAMDRLFLKMVENGCSDLHVSAGSPPLFRKDGRITDLSGEPKLSAIQSEALLMGITPDRYRKQFEERNDVDFAYEIKGVARFRCNLFRDRKGIGGVFRQIPADILTAEALGLRPQLLELCQLKKGLILVTGPTGSGKSTTLAALIDHINRTREDHIITIEDPIEFVHDNRKCLINQREVGEHTNSFKVALRAALREDPDIVLVGELRDLETVEIALETAETGHLVFGTLHTNTAPGTVSRLIDQFPAGQQAQIRTMLADTLKAVIAQTLCRKTGGGRVAALEVLVVNNAVANLIREDKAFQIPSAMQTGRAQGMNTLNDALLDLVQQKVVTAEEAYWNAVDKSEFLNILKRNGIKLPGGRAD